MIPRVLLTRLRRVTASQTCAGPTFSPGPPIEFLYPRSARARDRADNWQTFPGRSLKSLRLGSALCHRCPALPADMVKHLPDFFPVRRSFSLDLADFLRADRDRQIVLKHVGLQAELNLGRLKSSGKRRVLLCRSTSTNSAGRSPVPFRCPTPRPSPAKPCRVLARADAGLRFHLRGRILSTHAEKNCSSAR
jgi:hypothetical protein